MKKIIIILFLSLFALKPLMGQNQTKIDTAEFKTYTACPDCFENWNKGSYEQNNVNKSGSNSPRRNKDNSVAREGKRVWLQALTITGGIILSWFALKAQSTITSN